MGEYKKYIDHIDSSCDRDIDFLSDGCLFDYKDPVERREVSVSDHFDDDDDPIDGNADSNVCDMVKAGNAEYIHSPGIAQFFWKHLLYLFVSAVYEVVADQRNRSRPY